MYEYIKGELESLSPAEAIIENNGIGYKMQISLNTYTKLQGQKECQLFIYHLVREDSEQFYGFYDKEERNIFLLLISVSGIGANTARMMLSSMTAEETRIAILSDDVNKIKSIKGIGIKTAQRVIIELRDKVTKENGLGENNLTLAINSSAIKEEALSALVMLGFSRIPAEKILFALLKDDPTSSLENLIKIALKRL